jgi:undecaprenyl-diphosphatase
MTVGQAIVLGIVQGLGEFLPISSSGHLILFPWLFGWEDPGLAFDVALHMGTLAALLAYFGGDFLRLARAGVRSVLERKVAGDPERRLAWGIVFASVPAAAVGFVLDTHAEGLLRRPGLVAGTLIGVGLLLLVIDRTRPARKGLADLTVVEQVLIGVAQACALVPGVSRSGATITAGRALGATRDAAARFSFLLSAPITFGAGVLKLDDMMTAGVTLPFLTGILTSAVVGYLAIRYLLVFVRTRSYSLFVYYRLALGLLIIGLIAAR